MAHLLGFAPPVFDVLSEEAHLGRDGWDAERGQHVVIGIAAHLISNDLIGVAFEGTIWEWSIFIDILENGEVTWRTRLDIVWCTTVEWPHELVS